jgi:2-oxoglutarate dehydrogenase E2 component (dihydrolipoamide succinyltransferase)
MAKFELKLPKMGESVAEATITSWLKEVGDEIEEDEPVLEIATDKVDSEVPSEVDGKLVEKLFNEDDVVEVGQAIAVIETDAELPDEDDSDDLLDGSSSEEEAEVGAVEETVNEAKESTSSESYSDSDRFYSPLVRSIAQEEGVSKNELDSIEGSGKEGRVTKHDMLDYIDNRGEQKAQPAQKQASQKQQPAAQPKPTQAPVNVNAEDEVVEMSRMGKMVSKHMLNSIQTSAHVQSFIEVDVTKVWNWRNSVKKDFQQREGEKITFTPILIEAIVKAIKDFPMVNISIDGENIVKHKNVNLGMAAALPSGDLIVPVIKKADQLNLVGLTKQVNDLAGRARNNKLKPDDTTGGTYTVTNVGTFGSIMGTPIINQPQVGILALGAIRKVPAVVETPEGDFIGIRHKMFLSHSYDHRVVNGALGGQFVQRVKEYLEDFDDTQTV